MLPEQSRGTHSCSPKLMSLAAAAHLLHFSMCVVYAAAAHLLHFSMCVVYAAAACSSSADASPKTHVRRLLKSTCKAMSRGSEEMEVEAFRRLYPLHFLERFLDHSVRPDARPLGCARSTSLALGTIPTVDGSALAKLGNTTMLAGVKLEVMSPSLDSPDQGRIVVDFQMPPICSPSVRPGRPTEAACVISEQLSNALVSSQMVDLRDLSITPGKAAWIAYLDVYCLDADGSLFDAALLASVGALANVRIPAVLVTKEGKVVPASASAKAELSKLSQQSTTKTKPFRGRQLRLGKVPMALTCALHKKHLLADPTAEEESIVRTTLTVILDFSGGLVSLCKPGGEVLVTRSTLMNCLALAKLRVQELQKIFQKAIAAEAEGSLTSMDLS